MPLRWYGERIKAKVARASEEAIDDLNRDAARDAAGAWPRDTGASAESIDLIEPAHREGSKIVGTWGAVLLPPGAYSESSRRRVIFTEVGFRGRAGRHILRRTADSINPSLADRLRRRM